jgi:hypothetical protein
VDKPPPALPVISNSHPRPVKAIKVTPAVEVGILQERVSDKRVSLLVMLDEASITRMNAYDLSTFRLWLFSKEWRLLHKQLITVTNGQQKVYWVECRYPQKRLALACDAKAGILSAEVGAYANADSVAGTLDLSDHFAERQADSD